MPLAVLPICLLLFAASLSAQAGPGEFVRRLPAPPPPPLDLKLHPTEQDSPAERPQPQAVSPVFQRDSVALASSTPKTRTLRTENPDELANEQLARELEQQAYAASANSGACVARGGSDAVGAGVRWSLHGGFGFYWQGKGMRDLQRLMRLNEISAICPSGSTSPVCRTMPKQVCD
jgi:hypothetical protein